MTNTNTKQQCPQSQLSEPAGATAILALLICVQVLLCIGCTGGSSASTADGSVGTPPVVEVRTITLASGLVVDVRGPTSAIDALPKTLTGAELCEQFPISMTATFDAMGIPARYAATAVWHELVGLEALPPTPPPIPAVAEYLGPVFPDYAIPTVGRFGGVSSNPIAVFPLALTDTEETLPQTLAVFHHDTGVPMAAFNHSSSGPYLAFPSTWQDAGSIADGPSTEVWARYIEGQAALDQCDGYSAAIASLMNLSIVEDLASCGDLMAWPYSLPDPGIGSRSGTECVTPSAGFGVTLSSVLQNPWGTVACPRPPESQFEYVCFGQSAP